MTSPQFGLLPTRHDDGWAVLGTLEFVASSHLQLVEVVWTVVRQRMPLEPCPEVFDRIQIGCIGWQESDLNVTIGAVEVFADQLRFVRSESVQDDQQRLLQVRPERLEERDDFLFLDAAFVKAEQIVGSGQSGYHRQMLPVEMKLNHRRLPFRCPSAY